MKYGKYSLVVVDVQFDFCDPNGTMYVPGADRLVDSICDYIRKHHDEINEVVFTLDWHPVDHCSFETQGGQWPVHCVAYTKGASLPDRLLEACSTYDLPVRYVTKGADRDKDEYGAFADIPRMSYDPTNPEPIKVELYPGVVSKSGRFAVCGLCGDYCVMETIKNLKRFYVLDTFALPALILSIDGGKAFYEYCEKTALTLKN